MRVAAAGASADSWGCCLTETSQDNLETLDPTWPAARWYDSVAMNSDTGDWWRPVPGSDGHRAPAAAYFTGATMLTLLDWLLAA